MPHLVRTRRCTGTLRNCRYCRRCIENAELLYLAALYFSRLATGYYMYIVGYISRTLLLVLLQVRYQVSSELELDCVPRRRYIHTASPSPVVLLLLGQPEFEKV